jgi:TPR repeat protein
MRRPSRQRGVVSVSKLQGMREAELHALLAGDPREAAPWIALAASRGLAAAQTRLARMLLNGTGVAKDEKAALGWFKTAARAGDADAMNMVGRCYENGWGAQVDQAAAVAWYRRSADAGHDWGQYNYAHMLFDGVGVAINRAQALVWYVKAARQGHGRAMNLVARCHEEGWGAAVDRAQAAKWYRRSAEAGYFRGQYNYASLLASHGETSAAADWFWKAAEAGTIALRRKIADDLLARDEACFRDMALGILALCCESGDAFDLHRRGVALMRGVVHGRQNILAGAIWLFQAAVLGHQPAAIEMARGGYLIADKTTDTPGPGEASQEGRTQMLACPSLEMVNAGNAAIR